MDDIFIDRGNISFLVTQRDHVIYLQGVEQAFPCWHRGQSQGKSYFVNVSEKGDLVMSTEEHGMGKVLQ